MESSCPTRLLSDEPAETDAFGSHQRIAQAIHEMAQTEQGGKAIALTGSWGSGKSTVVTFLKQLAENGPEQTQEKTAVFVFDAWAHQGDPLRRSFLERIIAFLVQNGWTTKERWQDDMDGLARRKEDTVATVEPVLTAWGRVVALGLASVPIGAALVAIGGKPKWLGLLLTAGPILAVMSAWLCWRQTWNPLRKEFWTQYRGQHQDTGLAALFFQKTREVHKTLTIRTPNPTSIEFADLFSRATGDAMSDASRRLIVVIDNLDRLDPEDALAVWATMRTFFEVDTRDARTWLSRFWLLVPYDPNALDRLWARGNKDEENLVSAFVAKTFQLSLRVAPPVLSDWFGFLGKQLEIALPAHKGKPELDAVTRLYRLRGAPPDKPITPRDIKIFVNRVGALHRQWGDEIPLPVMAAYVLHQNQIEKPSEDLIRPGFLDAVVQGVLGGDSWQKYFASLYFNVPPGKALQVLIGQRAESALANGNSDALDELKDIPGFWEIVEHTIDANSGTWAEPSQPP